MKFENLIKSIKEFGFNTYEAKILSYLLLKGEASAPEMSKNLEIPNTKIYYVLDKLVKEKYIKKRSSSPVFYYIDNKEKFFDLVIEHYRKKLDYLNNLKNNILLNLSLSVDTKVIISKSEFFYYLSLKLSNVKILCNSFNEKCLNYIGNKRDVLNIVRLDYFPFFVLLSNEIFLLGVFNKDDFVVGFVTSECLEKFKFVFDV